MTINANVAQTQRTSVRKGNGSPTEFLFVWVYEQERSNKTETAGEQALWLSDTPPWGCGLCRLHWSTQHMLFSRRRLTDPCI